ncbi:MAG TPA: Gfo/Idh/MocA family oxidoreductase [Candidatus Sulfotelmatobacter sp.]|nr:Gfo/Idh/MocA family oxidoreductase [Candidatus Sulfotelmatobacter sp.]
MKNTWTRRDFIRVGGSTVAAGAAAKYTLLQPKPLWGSMHPVAPSDRVRFASIGVGIRGCLLLQSSVKVPGVECVGVSDLYDSRHYAAELALKKSVPFSRDYRTILDRKDVDAVIIATQDHQHHRVFIDACAAGKDVYCEKPMSHKVEEGFAMIDAAQKNNRVTQIGSQRVSSILYARAKEIYDSGKLGDVFAIQASWDRNDPGGAFVCPIPSDANEQTVDWNSFLIGAPKRPWDPIRFFRWRCFTDYGSGLGGDLFVHLISGIHFVTGTNTVAQRAQSAGGLYHYKDGRDFPDLIETFYDYPNFRVGLRCNLNNNQGEFFGFYGNKGTLIIRESTVTFTPQDTRPQPDEYTVSWWPEKLRDEYMRQWKVDHPAPSKFDVDLDSEAYAVPSGYDDVADHEARFFESVRSRKKPVENEEFGNNAALGCHLANYSYFNHTPAVWDAEARKIKG